MRFLIDERFPAETARRLRDEFGHDAVHVGEIGLRGAADAEVASAARDQGRVLVTGNVADLSAERDLAVVCVLKRRLPLGGRQAHALAIVLDRWAAQNPRPYLGQDWPE